MRSDIQFGVQVFAGVQLVLGQQSKNESYEFTRCKRESSFMLMFRDFSMFSGVVISVLRNVTPHTVGGFAKGIAKVRISRFGNREVFGREITGILFEPIQAGILARASEE